MFNQLQRIARNCLLTVVLGGATLLTSSCGHVITVTSVPENVVVSEITDSGKTIKLGKTPFTISDKTDLDRRNLLLEYPGFISQRLMIVFPYVSKAKIAVHLTPLDNAWYDKTLLAHYPEKIDKVVMDLIRFQNNLQVGSKNISEESIKEATDKYSQLSIVHTIAGVYYFRAGDFAKSKSFLEKALDRNSENEVARKMMGAMEATSK